MWCGIWTNTQCFRGFEFVFLFSDFLFVEHLRWRPKLSASGLESIHSPLLPRLSCLSSWENLNKRFCFSLRSQIIPKFRGYCFCFTVVYMFVCLFSSCEFRVYGVECELLDYTCDGKRWCWKIFNCQLHHWGKSGFDQPFPGMR